MSAGDVRTSAWAAPGASEGGALPPGPPAVPGLPAVAWALRPTWLMTECQRRYGDCFLLPLGRTGTVVVVADPELAKRVFTANSGLMAGDANHRLEPLLGRYSILLADGETHLRQRRLLLPPFHRDQIETCAHLVREVTEREIERWPTGVTFALQPRMRAVTAEAIIRVLFSPGDARVAELHRATAAMLDAAYTRLGAVHNLVAVLPALRRGGRLSPWRRFALRLAELDALLAQEIEARRSDSGGGRDDVCSLLVRARDAGDESLSDEEVRDQLRTLLLTGHETTTVALAWTFERLLRHPAALRRLADELEAGQESYLDAVVAETLRLRPPLPLAVRTPVATFALGPYRIPPSARIAVSLVLIHRQPELYPEPLRFLPERFVERPPETYTWIPFGGGPRRCIGAAFARMEVKTVIKTILARTELAAPTWADEPIRRRGRVLAPRHGGRVVLLRRMHPA
jgi:cytochrome P450